MNPYKLLLSVLEPAKKSFFLSLLFNILTVVANIALLGTSAWLIATAALQPELVVLSLAIVGVRFYGISRAVCRYIERYVSHHMAFQGLYALRLWFYQRLEPLAPAILNRFGSGDIVGRILGDIETLQFFYLRVLIPPATAVIITLALAIYLGQFNVWLSVFLLVVFLLGGVGIPFYVLGHNKVASAKLLEERGEVKATVTEVLASISDIISFDRREETKAQLLEAFKGLEKSQELVAEGNHRGDALFQGLLYVTVLISLLITIPMWHGPQRVWIAVISLLYQSYFETLQPLTQALYYHEESLVAAKRLLVLEDDEKVVHLNELEFVETALTNISEAKQVESVEISHKTIIRNDDESKTAYISFKEVSFSYGKTPVFDAFSFTIPQGEKLAIVGPSGSGKTSLFMMLERFYPYSGAITLGGRELRQFSLESLRKELSLVEQEAYLFHATLEDNLRIAKPKATAEELKSVLEKVHLTAYVDTLPMGLKTMVGSGGNALSGGQRQRVGLARAFLKDSPILLLDEPLEGLDRYTRQQLWPAILELMKVKTSIYITHQLDGLEEMDRILFLEKGQIKEVGSYEELMSKKGAFYQYVQLSMNSL